MDKLAEPLLDWNDSPARLSRRDSRYDPAVAQQAAGALQQISFGEFGRVIHQHGADLIGVREQECVPATQAEAGHVTLLSGEPGQEPGGVGVEGRIVPQQRPSPGR